jgi:hypothetical protein
MNKLPIFNSFYEAGDTLVTIKSATPQVDLPPQLRSDPDVQLILGLAPTPHLAVDQWGIVADLRFSGKKYTCRLPWASIIQLSGRDAVIQFKYDRPEEVAIQKTERNKENRANLRVVK